MVRVPSFDLSGTGVYGQHRDYPAIRGTTGLSPHLRFGTVGIRKVIASLGPDTDTFLGELIWGEFIMQVLYHYPHVVDRNFNRRYDRICWLNREEDFQSWCRGEAYFASLLLGYELSSNNGNWGPPPTRNLSSITGLPGKELWKLPGRESPGDKKGPQLPVQMRAGRKT